MARHLDLSKARAMVRSFDDPWAYRLGPALLSPLRYPIDLWPPPPSPQADVTGRFPLTALAADALTIRASVMSLTPDDTVSPPSAGLESDWRVQTAMRMELHTARSVRMSSLSNTPTKLQSCESTQMEDSEILVTPLPRISTPTDLDTNLDTSALHTVSQRSSPPSSPSLAGSVHTSLDLTVDGIETPTFYTLPPDPLDALEALEALAALQPLCPDTIGEEHLDPIEALLWSPRHDEVHPFRALPRAAQYTSKRGDSGRPPPG
ncbi:hypothetical protein CC85DRAFT_300294 [Cutaneotrichosporon oleaginosum]|uniref:Uncharacterized protein n=1 Tax=Cutaneotrichosporon oleaginosum TaxID=879819 RepID=A0A0J0XUG7_9TREE|nr:uncharacterized protein CC85DRAFT_300294 [Cutaneotrichosporon oleaginosum]KLT44751.1 hypothetical protein CC85DRAFT_300294 [Cutaneotrichosporon oleaginosum]TXT07737.1 hypothetical protein COLE_04661 [Cutaneotrichosporon oleaginosum]